MVVQETGVFKQPQDLQVQPGGHQHAEALRRIREIGASHGIRIHGTILEITECMPQLNTAVEVNILRLQNRLSLKEQETCITIYQSQTLSNGSALCGNRVDATCHNNARVCVSGFELSDA